ncbi:MAG: hypothetical protein AB7U73_25220 [Pirellulales bacterium]
MSQDHRTTSSLFTQVDISPASDPAAVNSMGDDATGLLRQILTAQDRQNELLEELLSTLSLNQRQRTAELRQWKQANPRLARSCRGAAEALSRVQTEFLARLTEEVNRDPETLLDGDFMLNEFVDRFGPRLAHLNGVLQVLSQLGSATPAAPPQTP